ncbi:hypothetical protein LTR78_008395 [Recurvomyces mirabilis]|uniref:Uncharacterized protein n=1 Tax=Recurvomyces mirabilis TaxID=574656 RepID=A0AAE0TQ36_9PEZI|nr:hypothetical protein LTR78_008395 [Recurvomyces mirabilis]KAK5155382.1 hypothetical protein LTS14_005643 [Recurvomyces mirabilis]
MESETFLAAVKAMQADVDRLKQENREGRVEVEASRKRIRYLVDETRDKDRRINVLRREKAELERRLLSDMIPRTPDQSKVQETHHDSSAATPPDGNAGSPFSLHNVEPATSRNELRDTPQELATGVIRAPSRRIQVSRFSRLPSSHKDWVDMLDDDMRVGAGSQEEALKWRTTKIRFVDLLPVAWIPRPIAPFDNAQRYDSKTKAYRNVSEDGESPGHRQEAQASPSAQDINTNRRLLSNDQEGYSASRSTSVNPRKRSPPVDDIDSMRYRRKAICVRCWLTSSHCDYRGQCQSCKDVGERCVRKMCLNSLECRRPGCPCLHPGQWHEDDEEWMVEKGPLPRRERWQE